MQVMLFKMHYLHLKIRYFAAKMHVLHFKKGLFQMLQKVKYVKVRRLRAFHETFRQAFSEPFPPNGAAHFRMFNNGGPMRRHRTDGLPQGRAELRPRGRPDAPAGADAPPDRRRRAIGAQKTGTTGR